MTQQEAEVILKVNSKEAREKLEKLQAQTADLRQQFAEAFRKGDTRGIDNVNKQLQKVNKEINNMCTNAANIRAAMVRLDEASPRELQRTIKLINNELNSGRVKRGTKEWDEYVEKLKEVQAELAKVKGELQPDNNESFIDKIKNSINDWGATAATAAAAFAGVVMSGKAAVQAYADMEAEEANVRKFTGMTAEEVASLNEEFKKLDTRTSREELNKLAQEAGRLGKTSQEDVLGFVRAADQINVALDDLGEGATLTLSKLTGIFGDEERFGTEKSLLKVGSVINELSQNCSASAPYLAEFSSRLGGIAAQSKMTISQVMAFGAVLDSNNLAVEASATAVGQLITSIYQEPAKIAKAAGMDVAQFSKMVKEDMNGALVALFEQLNRFGGMETLAAVFDSMGTDGARAIPVLTALAGHVDTLKWQQQQANEAFEQGISVTNEFNVQNNTVQAQLDKAKKGFNEMAVALGEQLLPVMRYCISGSSMLMRLISQIVSFIVNYKGVIITLTAAIISYTVAAKASVLVTKASAAITAASHGILRAYTTVLLAVRAAYMALTGKILLAKAALMLFNREIKANPAGILISLLATLGTVLITVTQKFNENRKAAEEAAKKHREWKESISDVNATSEKYSEKELTRLKLLYKAAIDESKSKQERSNAVRQLQQLYPDYFKNLSAESISVGKMTAAYNKLRDSILESARARAAADLIYENEKEYLKLERERDTASQERKDASAKRDKIRNRNKVKNFSAGNTASTFTGSIAMAAGGSTEAYALESTAAADAAVVVASRKMKEADQKMKELEAANNKLAAKFSRNKTFQQQLKQNEGSSGVSDSSGGTPTRGETDKERQEREKREREANKAQREAQKKAREDLKKDLDERKFLYLQAEAENLTLYVTGQQSYADYLSKKAELEKKYTDDVIKIHEKHNKLDIAAYGQALKSKADLLKKQQDEERKHRLEDVEAEHKDNIDMMTMEFFDTSSPDFQNKVLLNQALLAEDLSYLQKKRDLYKKGSKEWVAIDREYNERLKQDQLEKQKETAQALMEFEERYRKSSGSMRMQNELRLLDQLHEQKLISEEEYQRARQAIINKYEREDMDKARTVQSEYADMVLNLYNSFSKFFSELGQDGSNFWDNLSGAATAAFSIIGAALSQYSAYVSAERDLELAKIEKRYDKEIAAAGKNSKKKKKLEAQKEAEIAKVKKKYNDRAMKIEIAQAVASTAMAAINAYASAASIPKVGWIMAPIAAALALAAGAAQIATIKKQHEAQAAGYYEGGFTTRDPNNRREVGVVHANEFVANHQAVANPAISPVLRLIDTAQRNNTIGSLTAADVSNALGQGSGVSARGEAAAVRSDSLLRSGLSAVADSNVAANEAMTRLSDALEDGIEAKVILDGEDGFHRRYKHFLKLQNNPKR